MARPAKRKPGDHQIARRLASPGAPDRLPEATDAAAFFNRELSFLEFIGRVLEQAKDPATPPLERLRFLTISSTVLDEFFEIRVAGKKQWVGVDPAQTESDGLAPEEILRRIALVVHRLVEDQYAFLNGALLPILKESGIVLVRRTDWNEVQKAWVEDYFRKKVLPVLTPVGLDPAHPFPRVMNKALNFLVSLAGKDAFGRESGIAVVPVPRCLPRVLALPPGLAEGRSAFVLLSSIVRAHVAEIFPGMEATDCMEFRLTRNSNLWVDEEEVDDLLKALKGQLPGRKFGDAVRLEVAENRDQEMCDLLLNTFGLDPDDLYPVGGPVNLHRLQAIYDLVARPDLKYPHFVPGGSDVVGPPGEIFERLRKGDVLLHHPYESFAPVVELVRQASRDPAVLAIKQTLYRTDPDSPMVESLMEAARSGKEVTAVVELRARFDEAANITLASRLQEVGANVVYGVVGYKAHAKMILVVREEGGVLRRYAHLGTGNYHLRTSTAYADLSLLSAEEGICEDVHRVFLQLTGLGKSWRLTHLLQSPFSLLDTLLAHIEREIDQARQGRPARIAAKMNALSDPVVIRALYRASQAGVKIDLVVRGICCLRPGVPALSENIRVRSILGRFLEHHRVFYFHAGGESKVYASSADWMPRNLFRRVDVAFPIRDEALRRRVVDEGIEVYFEDNAQAWELQSDGTYRACRPASGAPRRAAQEMLLARLAEDEHRIAPESAPGPIRESGNP